MILMCYSFVGGKLHLYTRMDIMLYNNIYPYSSFGGIIKTHARGFLYSGGRFNGILNNSKHNIIHQPRE